ncbi:MAG: dTMP kinase [Leptospirales bacterium]
MESKTAQNFLPGSLFTFEGIDGSGKSTQARRIYDFLSREGHPVSLSREPGGTPLGETVRTLLLTETTPLSPLAELFLFLSDRAQHIDQVIRPALESTQTILVDRFIDATVAYQGYGLGHPLPVLETLHRLILGPVRPKRTFLLDLSPENAFHRIRKRSGPQNRIEQRGIHFFERVRNGYMELARQDPERIMLIDATLPEETITRMISDEIRGILDFKESGDRKDPLATGG